jgi:hypothetical protein
VGFPQVSWWSTIGGPSGPARCVSPQRISAITAGYLAGEPLAGPPDWWVETLAGFVADGFDALVFWPVDPTPDQVELLAGDVMPRLVSPAG